MKTRREWGCAVGGSVVWITGGGSGLGAALATEYGRRGARVAVSGRRRERLDHVVATLSAEGVDALAVPCDVTDADQVAAAVGKVVGHYGQLDVVVANAGFAASGRVEEVDLASWKRQFDVNVFGLVSTVQAALPHLQERGGRVALVGSVMARVTAPGNGPYASSKAAVRAIGDTLWAELQGTSVSCTTIHPGYVESEIGQVDIEGTFHEDWNDRRPQRLMWKASDAARVMADAIHQRRRQRVFTAHGRLAWWLAGWASGWCVWWSARS